MAPRYEQVAAQIRAAIESGQYPAGSTLPTVKELREIYGVSFTTVGRAIELLTGEDLVDSSHKHVGTVVLAHKPVRVALSRYRRVLEPGGTRGPWETACHDQGQVGDQVMLGVRREPAGEAVAQRLGIQPGDEVIVRDRHATLNGKPAQIHHSYYPAARFDGTPIGEPGKVVGGIYGAMRGLGIQLEDFDEGVTARSATPEEAAVLKLRPGKPVLVLQRVTRDTEGGIVEYLEITADPRRTEFVWNGLPLNQ